MEYPFSYAIFGCLAFGLAYLLFTVGNRNANLPPGPPTIPILGNLLDFPQVRPQLQFTDWSKIYGDVFSLRLLNKTMIVVSSPSAVREIIDIRSISSSNRPPSVIADGIIPGGVNFGMVESVNDIWRASRKAAARLLSNDNLKKYENVLLAESTCLMCDLVNTPEKWYNHVHRYMASFAMTIIYGRRSPSLDSKDIVEFRSVHEQFMDAMDISHVPAVELLPILRVIPERWASWKKAVKHIRKLHEAYFGSLLDAVDVRLQNGMSNGSFMEEVLMKRVVWDLDSRDILLNFGGVILQGSDTLSGVIQNIMMSLAKFPEVQKKLQEEIDRVVGSERAPTFNDVKSLPYLTAFIQECNRFRPVAPLALPHCMSKDEVVDGYLYPKGSTIIINLWAINHDPRYFDEPEKFKPERFLLHPLGVRTDVEDDPARRPNLIFGGGRRVCPGIALAHSVMEINAANFAWAFNWSLDSDSKFPNKLDDLNDYTTGITAFPKPKKIQVKPRSQRHLEIIQQLYSESLEILAPYDVTKTT